MVLALILLALILGGLGLLVKGLIWLVFIAAILVIVGAVMGYRGRSSTTA